MVCSDGVSVLQMIDHPGDDPLLADPQVHLSRDSPLVPEFRDRLLEASTGQHQPVEAN